MNKTDLSVKQKVWCNMESKTNLKTILLALLVMALWGSLFPFIKIGYDAFNIDSSSIPDIIMFAGCRFLICGIVLIVLSSVRKEKLGENKGKAISLILIGGLFGIILHYTFTYIGIGMTDSSKTALIKQLAPLLYACLAFLFIKSEKFSFYKIIGAIVGFLGIIAINYESAQISFTLGTTLIMLASVCSVISSVITQISVRDTSPFWNTAISQFTGGIILVIAAFIMGADMLEITLKSILVFVYICTASIIAYVLYGYLLRVTSVSTLFIIKFTEPLFACVFSAMLLGENIFKIQYLLAFIFMSAGIVLGNKTKDKKGEQK